MTLLLARKDYIHMHSTFSSFVGLRCAELQSVYHAYFLVVKWGATLGVVV